MQIKSVKPKRKQFFFQFWQEFAKTLFLVYSGPTFVVKNRLEDVLLVDDGPVVLGWVGSWSRPSCSPGCQVAEPRPQAIQATCSLFIPPSPPSNQYGNGYKACNNYSVARAWNERDIVQEVVEENMASWKWKVRVTIWSLVPLLARLPIVGREFVRRGNKI